MRCKFIFILIYFTISFSWGFAGPSWSLESSQGQSFELKKTKIGKKQAYLVTFKNGERTISQHAMPQKIWSKYQKKLILLTQETQSDGLCPHPVRVIIHIEKKKTHFICKEKLSEKTRNQLKTISEGLSRWSYQSGDF